MGEISGEVTKVRIYNQFYDIRGEEPEYVKKLAELLHHKMSEVSQMTPTVDTVKVAILAALNIADEYFSAQDRINKLEHEVVGRVERMVSTLKQLENPESP